jgi:hypothetical protein
LFTNKQQIQEALSRIGKRLAVADTGEFALLVCGGAALNLAGIIQRPTRDVDVLGLVKGTNPARITAEQVPTELSRAAELVAMELDLPSDWLNDAAMNVQQLGLPPGILKRAHRLDYGPCLTVFFIDRQDQVALKLYAAIDRKKGQRHLKDLEAIEPTKAEMEAAVHWLLDRKTSRQFHAAIKSVAEALGFPQLRMFNKKTTCHPKKKPRLKKP